MTYNENCTILDREGGQMFRSSAVQCQCLDDSNNIVTTESSNDIELYKNKYLKDFVSIFTL